MTYLLVFAVFNRKSKVSLRLQEFVGLVANHGYLSPSSDNVQPMGGNGMFHLL